MVVAKCWFYTGDASIDAVSHHAASGVHGIAAARAGAERRPLWVDYHKVERLRNNESSLAQIRSFVTGYVVAGLTLTLSPKPAQLEWKMPDCGQDA